MKFWSKEFYEKRKGSNWLQAADEDIILLEFVKDPQLQSECKKLKEALQMTKTNGRESDVKLFSKMLG